MEFLKQNSHNNNTQNIDIADNKINNSTNYSNIINEYSLKRNNFNPNWNSPNKFIEKLEYRMKKYYDDLNNF